MTDDSGQGVPEPSADECIRAGMYWFGRSDFVAAEAWWQRAVEIDPTNTRAVECLRLLEKTSSTGFKPDTENPFAAPRSKRNPTLPPEEGLLGEDILASEAPTPSGGLQAPPAPAWRQPQAEGLSSDPFDFFSMEQGAQQSSSLYRTTSSIAGPNADPANPWDEGPSRTSVVTVQAEDDYDAVPDPTPLPELDRERFFNRGDPKSREEIVDFLRATGDLPLTTADVEAQVAAQRDILFDDPIELDKSTVPTVVVPSVAKPAAGFSGAPGAPAAAPTPERLLESARDRFQLHDFVGALELLEQIPPEAPGGTEAVNLAAEARRNLVKMYESKIGDFDRAPRVLISNEEVIWLNLNHRAGFILSQIDGSVTYEDLIALSGMPRLDTVQIIADLLNDKVIG